MNLVKKSGIKGVDAVRTDVSTITRGPFLDGVFAVIIVKESREIKSVIWRIDPLITLSLTNNDIVPEW